MEVTAIAVVLLLGVSAAIVRASHHAEQPVLAPPTNVGPVPSLPSHAAPGLGDLTPGPETASAPSGFVQARYRAPARSASSGRTASGTQTSPAPSHSPAPSDGYPWTTCRSTGGGGLECSGIHGSFSCTTSSGTTSCTGSGVSFTCSTDAQSGARGCDGSSGSWRCGADPLSGDTHCGGSTGFYTCAAGSSPSEECSGSHTFYCYDTPSGRLCRGAQKTDPDCYFQPAFGVYCKG